ncbi:MAG TPA: cytochrome c [Steroidobacteraceae bacterium]|nr:cytochrome c [Steroidobacteraceae bacterium]
MQAGSGWRVARRLAAAMAAGLGSLGLGAGLIVASGLYNIGADDHHTALVTALITQLRDRSIAVRARSVAVPDLSGAADIEAGARRYALECSVCHLAPGVSHSQLRRGLYPHPPNLAQQQPPAPQRAFWVIKHGIKMSAMPAWGTTLDDPAIWELVAFIERMPAISPEDYQHLTR